MVSCLITMLCLWSMLTRARCWRAKQALAIPLGCGSSPRTRFRMISTDRGGWRVDANHTDRVPCDQRDGRSQETPPNGRSCDPRRRLRSPRRGTTWVTWKNGSRQARLRAWAIRTWRAWSRGRGASFCGSCRSRTSTFLRKGSSYGYAELEIAVKTGYCRQRRARGEHR